jgi:hypothetical protein
MAICPRVFAVDFSKILQQASSDTNTFSSVFDGKAQVSNLYAQSLHIAKQNELVATQQSLVSIVASYARLSPPCTVTTKDVLNVLYNSDHQFKIFFKHTVIDDLTDGTSLPSPQDITVSYKRFFACYKITNPTIDNYTALEQYIYNIYNQNLTNGFLLNTMDQSSL